MNNINKRKCCRCKVNKPENMFSTKKSGEYKKTCDRCLIMRKAYKEKTKCDHGRYQHSCKICKGEFYGEYIEVPTELIEMLDAYL